MDQTRARPVELTRLGLPPRGPGSLAGVGRRLGAVFLDWVCSLLVVRLVFPEVHYPSTDYSLATLLVFGVEVLVLTWLSGASFGQRLLRMRVARVPAGPPGFVRVAVRTLLLMLLVPALIWDSDGRGMHDRLAGTVLCRR